jgi:hypothetical protein
MYCCLGSETDVWGFTSELVTGYSPVIIPIRELVESMSRIQEFYRQQTILCHIMVIAAAGLILTIPSIVYGFPAGGHDSQAHPTWYIQFSEQLWAGELYPRWLINENAGLGSPHFFYYAPVPYYLSSILRPLFASDPFGWHQLGTSAILALIASGFGAYLWIKNITNRHTAFVAAILYMIMPYHVAIDLYERGAFSEYWAFVWMPFILYFLTEIRNGRRFATLGLAVSYALLIMTHLPTTLIFSIIPVVYSFYVVDGADRRRAFLATISAMILGIALSAIYLLPAMGTQDYVYLEREGIKALYTKNFLFAGNISTLRFTVELTLVVLGMMILASCAVIISSSSLERRLKKERAFWITVGIVSLLMMTPLSKPIVQIFPVLLKIHLPWRFNAVLVVATVALSAIGIFSLRKPYTDKVVVLTVISSLLVTSWVFFTIWQGIEESTVDKEPVNRIIQRGTFYLNFRPRWVLSDIRKSAEQTPQVSIYTGVGSVEIGSWKPRDIILEVNTPGSMVLTIGQLYYPGWTAQIMGEPCCLLIQPSKPEGLLRVSMPGGNYEVALRLTVSVLEYAGQMISAVSAVIFLLLAIWFTLSKTESMAPPGTIEFENSKKGKEGLQHG